MPRKRFISPEFFHHADLWDAELATAMPLRLAYAGLWTVADRRGLFWWRPRELKVAILPYDLVDFAAVLSALEEYGFVERYVVGGRAVGRIPSFERWQSFHKNEKPSDIPEPSNDRPTPSKGRREPSPSITASTVTTAAATAAASSVGLASAVPSADATVHEGEADHRVLLTAAANQGISELFGEQPCPIRWDHKGTHAAAAQLEAGAVPLEFARQQLYELARTRRPADGKAPRTLTYYVAAVLDAWGAEQAYRVTATHPVVPSGESRVLSWDAKIAREEEAARVA